MNAIEVFELNRTLFEVLLENKINIRNVQYIELVRDYDAAVERGEKKTYIREKLAERYGLKSAYAVTLIIRRMKSKLKIIA